LDLARVGEGRPVCPPAGRRSKIKRKAHGASRVGNGRRVTKSVRGKIARGTRLIPRELSSVRPTMKRGAGAK